MPFTPPALPGNPFFGLDRPASAATAPAAAARPMNADAFATPGLRGVITVGRDAQAHLLGAGDRSAARPDQASPPQDEDDDHRRGAAPPPPPSPKADRGIDPGAIIRRALAAAGLLKRP